MQCAALPDLHPVAPHFSQPHTSLPWRLPPPPSHPPAPLQPPPEKSVAGAIRTLQDVGALSRPPGEALTPLGHHLAALPVDARVGKLLLLGASLGCLAPALTIAACLRCVGVGGWGGGGGQ